jgi:KDO2-lipid IV(A) lauroyltransferase
MINKWLSNASIFFLYIISLLPLFILYFISDILFFFIYYVIKYRRKVVYTNLKNSFPHKTEEELRKIEKKYFSYLGDLIIETIKMFSASPEFIYKRYTFKNTELLRKYEQQNQSFLFAVGHFGNWEWNAIVTPMVTKATPIIIYKPMNNKVFDDFFRKAREKSGAKLVSMKNSMRKIVELKNQLTYTVFASDQTPLRRDHYHGLYFLNQPTAVFMGIEKISKSTGYPIVFGEISVIKRGYYSCEFISITENPKETQEFEITEKHVRILENNINKQPEYWLWSHKRWKFKPENIL